VSWVRRHRFWLARRATQLGILLLFALGAHWHLGVLTGDLSAARVFRTVPFSDPFAALQILATGHVPASTALLGAGIVLAFYFVVGGRSFCSWVCPLNLVTDLGAGLKRRFRLQGHFRVARQTRFWIMALALLVSAISGVAAFEWVSPVAITHRELIFGPSLGLGVVAAILLLDLFVLRNGWCGSVCPLGAFYSLVGRRSLVRMGFDAGRCDHCRDCVPVCPEPHVIDFHRMAAVGFVDSGDCTNCSRCLEVCPRDAYRFTLRRGRSKAGRLKKGDHHATQDAA
jgi:ferredoxin-type protein NapH